MCVCDLLSTTENSVVAYQRPNAVPVTNVQLGNLIHWLVSAVQTLFQSCEKYVQVNYEH